MNKKASYTSVKGDFPLKVLLNNDLIKSTTKNKRILPIHLRLNITNRCNLDCPWCSKAEVDRTLEMDYEQVVDVIKRYHRLGCRAITISGGGEPLMHKRIEDILQTCIDLRIQFGIITNGHFLNKIKPVVLNKATWIRVSSGDNRLNRQENQEYWDCLKNTIALFPKVDWGMSYVLTEKPDFLTLKKVIGFANKNPITHVRLISDLSIADNNKTEADVKEWIELCKINDQLVIYQSQNSVRGHENCVVGLLRPIVDTDGTIYPCCNTQFGIGSSEKKWDEEMSLGTIKDIESITSTQKKFNGNKCKKCYSGHYNQLLNLLLSDVKHQEFI